MRHINQLFANSTVTLQLIHAHFCCAGNEANDILANSTTHNEQFHNRIPLKQQRHLSRESTKFTLIVCSECKEARQQVSKRVPFKFKVLIKRLYKNT